MAASCEGDREVAFVVPGLERVQKGGEQLNRTSVNSGTTNSP